MLDIVEYLQVTTEHIVQVQASFPWATTTDSNNSTVTTSWTRENKNKNNQHMYEDRNNNTERLWSKQCHLDIDNDCVCPFEVRTPGPS